MLLKWAIRVVRLLEAIRTHCVWTQSKSTIGRSKQLLDNQSLIDFRPAEAITAAASSNNIDQNNIELSVVIPAYGASTCLLPLDERLRSTLDRLGIAYEIVYIDDRSPDETWSILQLVTGS